MSVSPAFSRAKAEQLLGPAVIAQARRIADAAPPLRPELREQLRAVFMSASEIHRQPRRPVLPNPDRVTLTMVRAEPTSATGTPDCEVLP